jgi:chromosome segregation ATPase
MNLGPVLGLLLVGGPCDAADPGKGGFFAGLAALSNDCYEKRIEKREEEVDQLEIKQDSLEVDRQVLEARSAVAAEELERLRAEHIALKRRIVKLNSDLAARRVELDSSTRSHVQQALIAQDAGASEADRIASLRVAIENARVLVEKLSRL